MAATKYRIFPLGDEQSCLDYIEAANIHAQKPVLEGGLGMPWPFCALRIDRHGQYTTQLLGEGAEFPIGTPLVEDPALIAIAVNSVIADRPEMPEEDEE